MINRSVRNQVQTSWGDCRQISWWWLKYSLKALRHHRSSSVDALTNAINICKKLSSRAARKTGRTCLMHSLTTHNDHRQYVLFHYTMIFLNENSPIDKEVNHAKIVSMTEKHPDHSCVHLRALFFEESEHIDVHNHVLEKSWRYPDYYRLRIR